ncbi:hypothetical protein ACM66Z_10585 [Sulfurovum sp. ST-21]|uniref:Uncharacterized protein n=1 Tax=Sulfurovum indicum TaxID=2779528 RepID=A0A7M1S3E3_9BACT|nr:hypothetical protein [Sulfurovum indicum]QOR61846.1 hypothetical protein IMZ28_10570 [Sulfurovum indicum]
MSQFQQIDSTENIRTVIKAAFDTDLPLSGGWGYTQDIATLIDDNPDKLPLSQLEHMIASMRAYLEMNLTQEKAKRYGSINLREVDRSVVEKEKQLYHKVIYEISAMREEVYAAFIDEYKEGYGKENFDIALHFQRRKEATLIRKEIHWFEVSQVI